jgi:RNA polymerase sporulation-specific sigma factor
MGSETPDSSLLDVLPDQATGDAEDVMLQQKLPKNLHEMVKHALSDLEHCVLRCYLEGMSYREMSAELRCHTKSIDNALQRVKRKIGLLLRD